MGFIRVSTRPRRLRFDEARRALGEQKGHPAGYPGASLLEGFETEEAGLLVFDRFGEGVEFLQGRSVENSEINLEISVIGWFH